MAQGTDREVAGGKRMTPPEIQARIAELIAEASKATTNAQLDRIGTEIYQLRKQVIEGRGNDK
jgi:hypothetical protein